MSVWKDSDGDVRFGWVLAGILSAALLGTALIVGAIAYGPGRWSCRNTAQQMGLPWRWSITTDCLVQYRDHWVPLDKVTQLINQQGAP